MRGRCSSRVKRVVRLHQGADRRTTKAQDEVSLPVAWYGAIGGLRRTLTDHCVGRGEGLAPPARARPRRPQRPTGPQTRRQLAAQGTSGLDEKRLVDGFVTDAHALIVREVEPQAAGDLL